MSIYATRGATKKECQRGRRAGLERSVGSRRSKKWGRESCIQPTVCPMTMTPMQLARVQPGQDRVSLGLIVQPMSRPVQAVYECRDDQIVLRVPGPGAVALGAARGSLRDGREPRLADERSGWVACMTEGTAGNCRCTWVICGHLVETRETDEALVPHTCPCRSSQARAMQGLRPTPRYPHLTVSNHPYKRLVPWRPRALSRESALGGCQGLKQTCRRTTRWLRGRERGSASIDPHGP